MHVGAKTQGFYSLSCLLQLRVKIKISNYHRKTIPTYYCSDEQERADGHRAERDI